MAAAVSLPVSKSAESIYLDHAAATPLDPRVDEAMRRAAAEAFANPSSPHAAGRRARAALEDARDRILAMLGGRSSGSSRDRLIFTSGATEANRLGMLGTVGPCPGTVGVSPRDHGSVIAAAEDLAGQGWRLHRLPLAADGSAIAAAAGLAAAEPGRVLVSTTLVCGQTGIRESPAALSAADIGGRLFVHADATQAAAWDSLSFDSLPVTSLALAPHKFGRSAGNRRPARPRRHRPRAADPRASGTRVAGRHRGGGACRRVRRVARTRHRGPGGGAATGDGTA